MIAVPISTQSTEAEELLARYRASCQRVAEEAFLADLTSAFYHDQQADTRCARALVETTELYPAVSSAFRQACYEQLTAR